MFGSYNALYDVRFAPTPNRDSKPLSRSRILLSLMKRRGGREREGKEKGVKFNRIEKG